MEILETTYCSPREAAEALTAEGLRCSRKWILALIRAGKIRAHRVGGNYVIDIRLARQAVAEARERGPGRRAA